jgi:hypothetical protein
VSYLISVGDGLSQLVGFALLYTRNPNQSISGRAFEHYLDGRPIDRTVINALFFWQSDHCRMAWETDEERAKAERQRKQEYRDKYPDKFRSEI